MSRQRSRSPLHSRASTQLGRQDGYYGEQYHAAVRSDLWRGSEHLDNRNVEGGVHWDSGSSQAEEQVDHWAKFIEAIGQKQKATSVSRFHGQDGIRSLEEEPARSPRRLPREKLSSPEALHYGVETHQRIQSPGQRRNEHGAAHEDQRYSRSSSPRHSQGKRHDRVEHVYHNEEHGDRYERSSYSERSLKSNYSEHQLHFKGFQDLDPQEQYPVSQRGFSPQGAPVIVEHDHGIPKHDARNHDPGRDRERPRSRDPAREQERPRSRDPARDRGQLRIGGPARDRDHPRNRDPVSQREHPRSHEPGRDQEFPRGGGPVRHQLHPRSHDPVRERGYPRGGGPVRHQLHPKSHDPVRERGFPRGGGPVRHQLHPKSHDPVKQREHPRSHDPLKTSDLPRDRSYPKSREPQRGRDATRGRKSSRSKDLRKHESVYNHHPGTSHDDTSGSSIYHVKEDSRLHTSPAESSRPLQGIRHHKEASRMVSHSREPHGSRAVDEGNFRIEESSRARAAVLDWEDETQPRRNQGGVLGQGNVLKRNPPHRKPNHPGTRMDFASHETLKIKVDMSRPLHQSSVRMSFEGLCSGSLQTRPEAHDRMKSHIILDENGSLVHFMVEPKAVINRDLTPGTPSRCSLVNCTSLLGYSSERQLSLDLVNVGRQRLDFLPMLEHSGKFKETPMHSGTFAQEIITLVHKVKEIYFQGQGMTLNERFSNEHEYCLADEFAEDEQEMEDLEPAVNRPLGSTSLDTQIFCNIGPMQSQRKPHVPAPGDLRHDLERKRQERLEGVKITISGGNFSQILPQSRKEESEYLDDEDLREAAWSQEVPQETEHWDDPRQKRPAQSLGARRNFTRARNRPGQRVKRSANNSARW